MANAPKNVVPSADDAGWETVVKPFAETYPFDNEGDVLIGVYTGKREVEQDDLQNPGEKRMATVYEVTAADDGKEYSVWSSFAIDEALGTLPVNSQVHITYEGKVAIDNGRRSVKRFTVKVKRA